MKIAIIGAGFCGLATAWHLSKHPDIEIVIFDPKEIGTGTSGIAAGMLHPYVGTHSKLNWKGFEGLQATCELIKVAETALKRPISSHRGMLRIATTEEQVADFSLCAHLHNDVKWLSADECQHMVLELSHLPGIFIPSAITVDCPNYLKGLWLDCSARNVTHEKSHIKSLKDLKNFDTIVIAMGADTVTLPELKDLPLRPKKGQILEFAWPRELAPLPFPLNSQAYLLMHPNKKSCLAGATFEKGVHDYEPDVEVAKAQILPKIRAFFPLIDTMTLIDCRAGVRTSTPDRKPMLKQISENCWVLAGMGSKGLLYHALFAKELSHKILHPSLIFP